MIKPLITYEASCDGCGLVEQFVSNKMPSARESPLPTQWKRVSEEVGFNRLKRRPIFRVRDLCSTCLEKYEIEKIEMRKKSLELSPEQIAKIAEALSVKDAG